MVREPARRRPLIGLTLSAAMSAPLPDSIEVNPQLTADQLFDFYQRNDICEVGFGKEIAARILRHPHLMVGAFHQGELVGLARATFDGLSAHVMEFSIDLRWQGKTRHNNGSLVEADPRGLGRALGERLLYELFQRGVHVRHRIYRERLRGAVL